MGVKSVFNLQTNIPNWKQIFKLVEGDQATFFRSFDFHQ